MHPPELKTKFLELRAQGVSYGRIAEAIGVSKPTVIQWGKAMAEEIADLQEAERELVREKLLGNFEQWLGRQVHHFNRLDEEFGRREFKYSPTESVFRMMMASRKLLDRYFFEGDRPRSRRDNGRAVAPSGAAPATSDPGLDHNHDLAPDPVDPSSAPSRLGCEINSENPSKIQPSPHQNEGGSPSDPRFDPNHNLPLNPNPAVVGRAAPGSPSVGVPSAPQDPKLNASAESDLKTPKFESNSSTVSQCLSGEPQPSVYSENPAKTLPFPCQNSGVDNHNLSPATESQDATGADTGNEAHPQNNTGESSVAGKFISALHRLQSSDTASAQSEIVNPQSEIELDGESVPFNPDESSREWLERQGLKIPKGARIVSAG